MASKRPDVILVNMPFHGYMPSLGLSLLKSCLAAKNISSKVLYFGLPFAERVGRDLYHCLANGYPRPMDLLGEWIFSTALFDYDNSNYVEEVLVKRSKIYSDIVDHTIKIPDGLFEKLWEYQSMAPEFVSQCADEVLRYSPKVVGIGSVFHQQMSSLSLAKRIKELSPETLIVVGGGNCEGVMGAEMARQFPFVDAIVSGEAELAFPEIVQRHLQQKSIRDLKGVYTADNVSTAFDSNQFPSVEKIQNLDDLPYPDFDDFFEQRAESSLDFGRQVLFESSRGCWWGERSHCTFCGISNETMGYRSKSPQRAFEEISYLSEKYNSRKVHVVDCILDLKYFKDFLPKLAERETKLDIFYEVKANLKKDQLRLLFDAGVTTIQPGIESFRNALLQLMGKGVTALQNIQLLKWCKELGVRVSWNILWGFPGEDPQEYDRMKELIPYLTHLPSPQAACRIRLDRFSPNYEQAKQFGSGIRMLLDCLVSFQLLTKSNHRYWLTPISSRYLRKSSPEYFGYLWEDESSLEQWSRLNEAIRSGKPFRTKRSLAEEAASFAGLARTLQVVHWKSSEKAAQILGAASRHVGMKVLDVACGSGVWGIAIAQADSQSHIVANDLPEILELTKAYVKQHNVEKQFTYLPGDLRVVDFGEGCFDLAILGNIIHSEGEHYSRELLAHIHRALKASGRIAIIDIIPYEERTGPQSSLIVALAMLLDTEEGDLFTLSEYQQWLTETGFTEIKTADIDSHSPMIIAHKLSSSP
jgi:ribosomal peptide maturation radical SAM protein 1